MEHSTGPEYKKGMGASNKDQSKNVKPSYGCARLKENIFSSKQENNTAGETWQSSFSTSVYHLGRGVCAVEGVCKDDRIKALWWLCTWSGGPVTSSKAVGGSWLSENSL